MAPKRSSVNKVLHSVVRKTTRRVVSLVEGKGRETKLIEQEERETQEEETLEGDEEALPHPNPKPVPIKDLEPGKQQKPARGRGQKQAQPQDDDEEAQEPEEGTMEEPKIEMIKTPPREKEVQTKKNPKGKGGRKKGRRSRTGGEGGGGYYKRYVFRVLKQVHPEVGISSKAMTIVNNLMGDMFERLAEEAGKLSMISGRQTMTSREVLGAVKLVLPGELGKHAVAEGSKAVSMYSQYGKN